MKKVRNIVVALGLLAGLTLAVGTAEAGPPGQVSCERTIRTMMGDVTVTVVVRVPAKQHLEALGFVCLPIIVGP